jgi:hypothetical protein
MHPLTLPDLPAPYAVALEQCLGFIFQRYEVLSVIASGTIVRGTPDPASDLDMFVLHRGEFRERLQRRFATVPCEIFVNPPSRVPQYFEDEIARRRPSTAHMFATGFVLYDPEGVAASLVDRAKAVLACPPAPSEADLLQKRYFAATLFEDAEDLLGRDPEAAALLLGEAVIRMAECRVASEPGWLPRAKDLLESIRAIDPACAELAAQATTAMPLADRFDAARRLCLRVTGFTGFFEWTGPRESAV